jgi:ubiquinone/menaquinone biosynthesis C-methylase UbiE
LFDINKAARLDIPGRINELKPLELMRNVAQVKKGMVCVDLACGTGTLALPMAELAGVAGTVYAVDRSAKMLEHLWHKIPPGNIVTVESDVANTGLDAGIADFCLMAFILHEVEKPELIIAEAARLLKPGARAMVVEWREDKDSPGPSSQVRVKKANLARLFEENGFFNYDFVNWSDNYYAALAVKKA